TVASGQPWHLGGGLRFSAPQGVLTVLRYEGVYPPQQAWFPAYALGTLQMTAAYLGDEVHAPSSTTFQVVVGKATPFLQPFNQSVAIHEGEVARISIQLNSATLPEFAQPTGTVTLARGNQVITIAAAPSMTF